MTSAPLNPLLAATPPSPIMTVAKWVEAARPPPERPLLSLAQAAPTGPPPKALRDAMAAALERTETHLYGPVLGDDPLRAEIAEQWSTLYQGEIEPAEVGVTSGCNQAFAAALLSLAGPGDEVILPTPWYFNHKMWLDMTGVRVRPLPCGEDGLLDPETAAALIGPKTRAIALVSPNNPTGADYTPALLGAVFDLCAARGIALVIDETYRDFRADPGAPHDLFARRDWRETLVHLYSFSKAYRLTGHRVGAVITGAARLAAIETFLDTVTICPTRLGQIAALEGLRSQAGFVACERAEFAARRRALEAEFAGGIEGWELLGAGAYFAYVRHPFDEPSDRLARRLLDEASLLMLPGTFFAPEGDAAAARAMRIAFANVDEGGIAEMARRLRAFGR